MDRKYLDGLGLDKEIVEKIMAEHGKSMTAEKSKTEAAKQQLADVQKQLKAFDGVDVEKLRGEVEKMTKDIADKDAEFQKKLADIEFSRVLETAVAAARPRNAKAVMALLDTDKLRESKNQQADIAAAVEAVKKENDYLFEGTARITGPTPGPKDPDKGSTAEANAALRSITGKGD